MRGDRCIAFRSSRTESFPHRIGAPFNERGRMKVAIYARVSTDTQTTDIQLRDLHDVGQRLGWTILHEYVDEGISGAKGRDKRPAFNGLMHAVTQRKIDLVAAWSVDRLSRSLSHLVGFMEELKARDIGLYLHRQQLDTSTPSGRAMLGLLGVFSEFERSMIRDRVVAGVSRARAQGKRLGRPPLPGHVNKAIRSQLEAGESIRRIAKLVGVGVGTVSRIKSEWSSPDE